MGTEPDPTAAEFARLTAVPHRTSSIEVRAGVAGSLVILGVRVAGRTAVLRADPPSDPATVARLVVILDEGRIRRRWPRRPKPDPALVVLLVVHPDVRDVGAADATGRPMPVEVIDQPVAGWSGRLVILVAAPGGSRLTLGWDAGAGPQQTSIRIP